MGDRCWNCQKTSCKVYNCQCVKCCSSSFFRVLWKSCEDCLRGCPRCGRWFSSKLCAPKETPTCKLNHKCKIAEFCGSCAKESICHCCNKQSCDAVALCQGAKYCNELVHFCCKECRESELTEELENTCKMCGLTCCDSHKLECKKGIVCRLCAKDISRQYVEAHHVEPDRNK